MAICRPTMRQASPQSTSETPIRGARHSRRNDDIAPIGVTLVDMGAQARGQFQQFAGAKLIGMDEKPRPIVARVLETWGISNLCSQAAGARMELVRGRDGYRGKEVRGEIVRRGARAARGDDQVGHATRRN